MLSTTISFSPPEWLINFYHAIILPSFFINFAGIYLILFQSGKIDNYKYFLLWFTICCLFADFYMFFLMQPIPLLPIWAGYIHGPLWSVFRVSTHTASVMASFIIGQQFSALTMCFVRKYQAISKIDWQDEIRSSLTLQVYVLLQIIVSIWITLYYFTGMSRDSAIHLIKLIYPENLYKFLELEDFQLYTPNLITSCFMAMAAVAAATFTVIIIWCTIRMLKVLHGLEQHVSPLHLRKHKSAVSSLVAQFVTSSVAMIPPVACGVLMFFEFQHIQELCWMMLAVSSLHGILNCLVMMLTYQPYRDYVGKLFCKSRK